MDNQQEIAYMAGLFDGEGTCGIYKSNLSRGNVQYKSSIAITNTDKGIIDRVTDFCKYHNLNHHIYTENRKKAGRKTCYTVSINNYAHKKKFLTMIRPYLAGVKKDISTVIIEHIEYRQNVPIKWNRKRDQVGRFSPTEPSNKPRWGEKDEKYFEKYLSIKAKSSETTREAPVKTG
jgi:hypothetical protein